MNLRNQTRRRAARAEFEKSAPVSASGALHCPSCGSMAGSGKRFCADCGTRLGTLPAEEVRTVTCLFADVADSTTLAARLGLEAVKAVMDRVFERLYQVIVEHGGTVDKFIGDCVMALFGAPLAFGDDAARAVRAGLAIQRAMVQLADELEAQGLPSVKMRVGINTGPVIAGPVGAGPERRYTVLGHAVNVAAHLQQVAPVGGVLLGEETCRRIRGLFRLQPCSTPEGEAHLALGERSGGLWLRPREILGREIEAVGRSHELAALLEAMRECTRIPEARLMLVTGEPGIGKSRLVLELFTLLERELPQVERVVGYAHPLSAAVPFSVAAEAIRRGLSITTDDSPAIAATKLRAIFRDGRRICSPADQELLARVLGLPGFTSEAVDETALQPRRVLDLLALAVDWMTDRGPLLLVTEDLHWCDSSSLELMDHLLQRLARKPLLIVGLTRPELAQERPALFRGPRRFRLDLAALDGAAVAELLEQVVGKESGERLLGPISRLAMGNPYYVEELLRTLDERGVLERRISGWHLSEAPLDLEIPPGVESVVQARIDHLSPAQRHLLCLAAVAGPRFWDGLLRTLSPDYSAQDLSVLVQREMVGPRQGSAWASQLEYAFVHHPTREVAYRMLPDYRRTELHRRVAGWLVEQGAAKPEELALVGRHLDLGGQPEEAAHYLAEAGNAAFAAAAYSTAALHYSRASELTRSPKRLFDILARRERVLNALGRWAEQRRDAERMLELATQLGSEEGRMEALLRLGRAQLNVGDLKQAERSFREAYQRAVELSDMDGLARCLRWLAMYHFNRSEHAQARSYFEQALELAEHRQLEGLAAELAYELAVTVGTIGDYPRALEVSQRALEMFRRQANRYQESFCLGNIGCFHTYLGEYAEAVSALEQAAELGRAMGIPLAEASAKANLGNAYRLLRRPDEALALEDDARRVAQEIGDPRLEADALVYGALAALTAGRTALAEELSREAAEHARNGAMLGTEATALMVLARAAQERGELPLALTSAEQSVALLERAGAVEGFEQEILRVHAELCSLAQRPEEAARSLSRAREDLERKVAFIAAPERRRRFLAHAASVVEPSRPQEEAHRA